MTDLELLKELVAFEQYGTLSATAEHLMITQPSVTRGMKKLEQELGVALFNREANRITLNETGKLAAKKAKELLQAEQDFTEAVINFGHMQEYINVGGVIPGPILYLENLKDKLNQSLTFNHQLVKPENVVSDLMNYKERLIFTDREILDNDEIESMFLGVEKLAVKISEFNPLSTRTSVSYKDLEGQSFLVVNDIGSWKEIIRDNIPNAKFLFQEDLNSLDELTQYSNFPVFRTNLTQAIENHNEDNGRKLIPIKDDNDYIEVYGTYLTSQRSTVQPLLKELAKNWPQDLDEKK